MPAFLSAGEIAKGPSGIRSAPAGGIEAELLIHSAKMSALGEVMAGIVHEINTPLAYVDATFSLLSRMILELVESTIGTTSLEKTDDTYLLMKDIHTLLEDGKHGIDQIGKIISSLRKFSRLDTDVHSFSSIASIMDDVLLMARHKIKYLDVVKDIRDLPLVNCSATQIGQVLLNILINAAQAIEMVNREGRIGIGADRYDDDNVVLYISDNGPGIPPEIREKIFDPFYTTKAVGEGTGLGLSICYRIIRNHGGRILVDSEVNVGTTFSIILPISGNSTEK